MMRCLMNSRPKTVVVAGHVKFSCRDRKIGEFFDHFLTDPKKLVKPCDLRDHDDSLLRDISLWTAYCLEYQTRAPTKEFYVKWT